MSENSFDKSKLSESQLLYMKIVEQQNLERVEKLRKLRAKNRMVGIALGVTIVGIYSYSILAVRQEKFLDELDTSSK